MTRRLALKAERLTELTTDDLAAVHGARALPTDICFVYPTQLCTVMVTVVLTIVTETTG